MTTNGLWLYAVPENARRFECKTTDDILFVYYELINNDYHAPSDWDFIDISVPSGSTYTPLFTTKNATEEDWGKIVNEYNGSYEDYYHNSGHSLHSATSSGHFLLIANGLDVNKNYLIIKIEK